MPLTQTSAIVSPIISLKGLQMQSHLPPVRRILGTFVLLSAGHAVATTIGTYAYTQANHIEISDSNSAEVLGANSTSIQTIDLPAGGVFASASAVAIPGELKAVGDVRTSAGGGSVARQAIASYGDAFPIFSGSMSGTDTFTGSILVFGRMLVDLRGRAYSDSMVQASGLIDPHTGFNNGIVSSNGSARHSVGFDIPESIIGTPAFVLAFTVPFTFNLPIEISMRVEVSVAVINSALGSPGHAIIDYGHIMACGGISDVRDSSGALITNFTSISSDSGFNFETSPVSEPSTAPLLLADALLIGLARTRRASIADRNLSRLARYFHKTFDTFTSNGAK